DLAEMGRFRDAALAGPVRAAARRAPGVADRGPSRHRVHRDRGHALEEVLPVADRHRHRHAGARQRHRHHVPGRARGRGMAEARERRERRREPHAHGTRLRVHRGRSSHRGDRADLGHARLGGAPLSLPTGTPPEPLPVDAEFDVTIIGAGPVGLFAAFYAGLRTMKVKLLDSLAEPGGQLAALYPDKYIHDVAGFPKVKSRDLVNDLVEQALQYGPTMCLGEQATTLAPADGGWVLGSDRGRQHRTKTLLLTAGIGYFAPRKLTDASLARFEGHGLHYVLPGLDGFRGRRVLLLGGGDTAVDWALHLEPLASELTLIHRRDQFRAHEDSVNKL